MAKANGIAGKATGKLGNSVYAISCGEQVVREYNPHVANPNSAGQVNTRSKLKLMSQLSAAMAPVIAIPRQGLKSPRNLFVKKNHSLVSVVQGNSQISYENIQLTNGSTALPAVALERIAGNKMTMALKESAPADISRVVYSVFIKTSENKLQLVSSLVVNTAGVNRDFATEIADNSGDVVVYAYGMKDLNAAATAKYLNYGVQTGTDVANLIATRKLTTSDMALTETRGTTIFSGESENIAPDPNQRVVYIAAQGPGSVAGDGFTNGRKAVTIGTSVTITATPQENMNFTGWYDNSTNALVSSNASYTFSVTDTADLVARFVDPTIGPDPGDDQD